ncbi:hypothetical protein PHET_04436 [Paragonimus heterotremus]|uniref:SCP domain-containing protein n=1 Tax=Paragonimus heterotremus TaxID=100268 RepID=A0A8J4SQD4_9TREM|nr:hypothetical protein PHET_04436 [Paragonimus heterotremus]
MDEQFNRECLEEHNRLRSLHGCPPLELDVELAQQAQAHTEKMASKNSMHHVLARGHGENLCMRDGNQPTEMNGNFSQIVWKSTKRAGFGRTIKNGGCSIYVAAYYSPSGNISGHFIENVPAPLSGEIYIPTDSEKGW